MFHTTHPDGRELFPETAAEWFARMSLRFAQVLAERRHRLNAYRDLRSLDEHALRDIGLSHRAAAQWQRPGCDAR